MKEVLEILAKVVEKSETNDHSKAFVKKLRRNLLKAAESTESVGMVDLMDLIHQLDQATVRNLDEMLSLVREVEAKVQPDDGLAKRVEELEELVKKQQTRLNLLNKVPARLKALEKDEEVEAAE